MNTKRWPLARRIDDRLLRVISALAAMMLALNGASSARAQVTLAYSFESDLDGFAANGGGVTTTQDTIGATDGDSSMKVEIVQGATFVGALTSRLAPEIADPPGLDAVLFDLTITEAFPTEGFVSAGITIFGASQPDHPNGQQFGLQAQFQGNEVALGDLTVGTHPLQINLTSASHPLTFVVGSFNDIFGMLGSGVNDLIPGGFQIYVNKSNNSPWTGYIDNIRLVTSPDADFNDDTVVDAADLLLWEGAFGPNVGGDADGDLDSDGDDFLIWQRQVTAPGGAAAVPEPATVGLAATLLLALLRGRTQTRTRRPGPK